MRAQVAAFTRLLAGQQTRGAHILAVLAVLLFGWTSVALAGGPDDCLICHSDKSLTMKRGGKTVSLFVEQGQLSASPHASIDCIKCHVGFVADSMPHATRIKPVNCGSCHKGAQYDHYSESVHAKATPGVTCVGCHSGHAVKRVTDKDLAARHEFATQVCAGCHAEVSRHYAASDHGKALARGAKGAPNCIDCHGEHAVVSPSDSASKTSRLHSAAMCLKCHVDNADVRTRVGPSAGFIASYEKSVHGQAQHAGKSGAATCIDCHGSHDMMKGSNPASRVAKGRIAGTCGQCHAEVRQLYEASVHGKSLSSGVAASPTCTDCHGEHGILAPSDPTSPVAPANISAQVCTPCHGSVALTRKYGLRGDRFKSFTDSYHGLATRSGSVAVANCASCHGVHDIKPSSDPTSRIAPANLAATCGSCHPGANENFTKGSVHVIATAGDNDILSTIATVYLALIVVIIGGMFGHNVLDFVQKSRRKLLQRRGLLPVHSVGHRLYVRMSLSERLQHATVLTSFILLVVTGFALRFPEAWWVAPIRRLSPRMFDLRGIVHRIAGVTLVLVSLFHVGYVLLVPRGRTLLRDLLPARKDLADIFRVVPYYLGLSSVRPAFARFSYIEKSEYWALAWGTVVMAVTGVILWFDNTFLGLLTKLGWDIARTVHYYEAWLATLAILVWHFYFVIFNPDTYPINLAFWKGTLTEEEMQEDHPLELEEIKRREAEAEEREAADQ